MTKLTKISVIVTGLLVGIAGVTFVVTSAESADSTVSTVEGETMTSVEGWGTRVRSDSSASGGQYLFIDSNVTVRKSFSLPKTSDRVVVRARTDYGVTTGARTIVSVDGVTLKDWYVNPSTWTEYPITKTLAAGTHTLRVQFTNAAARNLYLDVTKFTVASQVSPSPSSAPTTASPPPPQSPSTSPSVTSSPSSEQFVQAYITGYSWFDNTPPGSAQISHPVIHQTAGGTGTYNDPITVAVGHSIINGQDVLDWPAGTKWYVPNLRRYFIVEDTCGDGSTPQNGPCHTGYPSPATTWLDVWVGGQFGTASGADACMSAITDVHTAIKNPKSNYVVVSGDIYKPPCTAQYGETPVTQ